MMSKRSKKKSPQVEVPQIGEPLENPNFVTPTAAVDLRDYGMTPFPGFMPPVLPEYPENADNH